MSRPTWFVLIKDEKTKDGVVLKTNAPRLIYEKETQADSVINSDLGQMCGYRKIPVQPLEDVE